MGGFLAHGLTALRMNSTAAITANGTMIEPGIIKSDHHAVCARGQSEKTNLPKKTRAVRGIALSAPAPLSRRPPSPFVINPYPKRMYPRLCTADIAAHPIGRPKNAKTKLVAATIARPNTQMGRNNPRSRKIICGSP